jgi:hypothetical protein
VHARDFFCFAEASLGKWQVEADGVASDFIAQAGDSFGEFFSLNAANGGIEAWDHAEEPSLGACVCERFGGESGTEALEIGCFVASGQLLAGQLDWATFESHGHAHGKPSDPPAKAGYLDARAMPVH